MADSLTSSSARLTLVRDLGLRLRERVLPELGSHAGRAHAGDGAGGDITFAVDAVAEESLAEFLAERAPRVAFYSEDRGLVADGDATEVLVVDPIDGTRPALAGLESACVAVALAPLGDGDPTMGDVSAGCVVEIKSGDWFLAARGQGLMEAPGPCPAEREHRPAANVLELRVPRPPGTSHDGGAGRADRRLVGAWGDLRAGVTGVLDDQGGDRPVGRGDRGRLPDDRRRPRDAGRVRAGGRRTDPQQLPVRPGRAVAVPDRGRWRRQRRLGRATGPAAAARHRPRVPDVVDLGRQRGAARAPSCGPSTPASSG